MAAKAWNDLASAVKTRGNENDVNNMRSVERKKLHWRLCYLVLSFAESRKVIKPQCTVSFSSFNRRKKAGRSWGTGIPTCNLCDLICLCLAMIVACPLSLIIIAIALSTENFEVWPWISRGPSSWNSRNTTRISWERYVSFLFYLLFVNVARQKETISPLISQCKE